MSVGAQKVVVIQDASRDASWSAIKWALHGFSLKPGDELIIIGVLHQVNNPSTFSLMGVGQKLGYKSKVDLSSMFGSNPKIVENEVAKKMEQYHKNPDVKELFMQCEMEKIKFHIEVHTGPSPKVVALEAAKSLRATWVILDRQMKKDKKFFMEKLSCGISRMKRNNNIEQIRGKKEITNTNVFPGKSTPSNQFSYENMIPGIPEEEISPKRSPGTQKTSIVSSSILRNTEASRFSTTEANSSFFYHQEEENTVNTKQKSAGEHSPLSVPERIQNEESFTTSPYEQKMQQVGNSDRTGVYPPEDEFENSLCSVCLNRRPKIGWNRDFTYVELHEATKGFSHMNFLSEGGFGSVYRGELKNSMKIAVKQHKDASFQGDKEFKSEVDVLSKARHQNLVMLLGSCSEGTHRLLVYEYVCNGSLDQHLSEHTRRPLNWDERIKIALGAAKGLEYLHQNNIVHRDMRPNNILVTHDHESLLGDFGLARTQRDDSDHSETSLVGTLGYMAPEYAECGKVSTKTDVYSFGVVLLQLITGMRTTDKMLGGKSLLGWAKPLLKEKNYPDLIDQRIVDFHDVHQLFWMVRVAEKCLSKDPNKRYTMARVVNTLNYIMSGNICIGDFSPTQSDSLSSVAESTRSQYDGETNEEEKFDMATPSVSSMSQENVSLFSSSDTSAIRSSTSTSSGQSTDDAGKNHDKKKGIFVSRSEVPYDEMII